MYAFGKKTHRPTDASKLLENFADPAVGNGDVSLADSLGDLDGHDVPTQKKRRGIYFSRNLCALSRNNHCG